MPKLCWHAATRLFLSWHSPFVSVEAKQDALSCGASELAACAGKDPETHMLHTTQHTRAGCNTPSPIGWLDEKPCCVAQVAAGLSLCLQVLLSMLCCSAYSTRGPQLLLVNARDTALIPPCKALPAPHTAAAQQLCT
ncbi:hypothetical protein COO60DRAFT_513456 [Scenedesmus sp. NREL 46B-D3]|nr:hypothetical protein COO60DRAFT_513456 [Scenedesmus sp. NREL 46B-D3]